MMQIAQQKTQSATRAARLRFALQMAEQAQLVGARIAEEREAREWSRPELARQLPGVASGNDVYRWETGKHLPRSHALEAIADLFGITVADLYAGPAAGQRLREAGGDLLGELSRQQLGSGGVPDDLPDDPTELLQRILVELIYLQKEVAKIPTAVAEIPAALQEIRETVGPIGTELATWSRREAARAQRG